MKVTINKMKPPKEVSDTESGSGAARRLTVHVVKELLAEQIGVEPDDLGVEDSFVEDLHMTNADLTDFTNKLEVEGVNPTEIDFAEIETLGELLENLGLLIEQNG